MPNTSSPAVVARFPLATPQRQFWFMDQVAPGDPTLNVTMRWELRGKLRAANLETAFQQLVARHETLRTRFLEEAGELSQEVVEHVHFRLGIVDLRTTPQDHHAARVDEIAEAQASQPFDLSQPGLLRVTLVQLTPERAILLLVVHHIVFDGFSIGVLRHEIGTLAAAAEAGTDADLPDLPLQYGDFALWQREYLDSGVEAADATYWAEQMRGAPYFELPSDKPRPPLRSNAVANVIRTLPAPLISALEAAAKASEVSLFTFGAAAASAALHRMTGADEVLISTPIAGRIDTDLEPLIGAFMNYHVLRLPTAGATAFDALLSTTRRVLEEAIAHQALPFAKLVEAVNPPRDPSRAPLASVAFTLVHDFDRAAAYGGFEMISRQPHSTGMAQDLHIEVVGRPTGWLLNLEYCPDLYEATTAEALADTLIETLRAVAEAPATVLDALPLAPALGQRVGGGDRHFARVEEVLSAHPEVAAVAAVPTGSASYAFVSTRPESLIPLETLPEELMGFAARRLAPEERPLGVSVLAALPLTRSGDIDRARLPRPLLTSTAPAPEPFTPAALAAATTPAPAANPAGIEDKLATIWSELLERPELPHDVSFFDLGGHSLLAVRLMAQIRQTWNVSLGVVALYTAPTLTELATCLKAELAPEDTADASTEATPAEETPPAGDWRIEPLLTEGSAQPILAVNDVALTLETALALNAPHPATCVRLFDGTHGIDRSPRSFEEIAAEYARVMRKAQPEGPYLLFGICVHGNIALEAARILAAEGAEVAGVVIKDVWEPGHAAAIQADRAARWAERRFALANKIRMVRAGTLSLSAMLGSYRLIRRTGILQLAAKLRLIDGVRASDLAPEQERFVSYISAARNRYRPQPLDLPVLHVVTKITPSGRHLLPSVGWERVVAPGQLKTVRLDEEVVVKGGLSLGTEDLAREIETWIAENGRGQSGCPGPHG